jgi:hypothetical protein
MTLTPEDIQFFSNEENWMFGPTYDLALTVAATDLKVLQEAISSFPGLLPWKSRDKNQRSILLPRDGSFRPVGLFHVHRVRDGFASYLLVIYPPSMTYVCGLEIWQRPKTEANILALRELHDSLLELVRWINARVPLRVASIHDETFGSPQLDDPCGYLWLGMGVAEEIGWTGNTIQGCTGISL